MLGRNWSCTSGTSYDLVFTDQCFCPSISHSHHHIGFFVGVDRQWGSSFQTLAGLPLPICLHFVLLIFKTLFRLLEKRSSPTGALELRPTSFEPLTTVTALGVATSHQLLYSMKMSFCPGTRYLTVLRPPATYMSMTCCASQSVQLFRCTPAHLCAVWPML